MKNMRYEDISTDKLEDIALREIRLFSKKLHLVPEWVTEGLSNDPYFGNHLEYSVI